MVETTPTFPVADMPATIAFYESVGFDVHTYDDGFAFVHFEGVSVFDLDLRPDVDPSQNLSGCFLIVPDADAWYARLGVADIPTSPIANMPWGMREFAFSDPNGNRVRVGTSIPT
jgi:catechol 2,3-dioxygenase-like lactoylglutathione lyase family enzyme